MSAVVANDGLIARGIRGPHARDAMPVHRLTAAFWDEPIPKDHGHARLLALSPEGDDFSFGALAVRVQMPLLLAAGGLGEAQQHNTHHKRGHGQDGLCGWRHPIIPS